MLLTHYYFQIQWHVGFYHNEIFFKFPLTLNSKFNYFVIRVRCRRKKVHAQILTNKVYEKCCTLSHLVMSFLSLSYSQFFDVAWRPNCSHASSQMDYHWELYTQVYEKNNNNSSSFSIIVTSNFVIYFHQTQSSTDLCWFSHCISSSHCKRQTQHNLLNWPYEFCRSFVTYY